MSMILTIVSSSPVHPPEHLFEGHLKRIINYSGEPIILAAEKATEVKLHTMPSDAQIRDIRKITDSAAADIFITPAHNRRKKLLLADMDSTMVAEETLDELAGFAGIKDQIAAITGRAMNGELNFHDAIRERVGLLKDLPATKLDETLAETTINEGAKTLVATMKANDAKAVLVSGGFTFFTKAIGEALGFDHNHGNTLIIENDVLTGKVGEPIQDKTSKLNYLNSYCEEFSISPNDVMSIGDGANDLPMLQAAGLGIGFYAKPSVETELTNFIRYNDLSAALFAQGYSEKDFVN